MKTVAKNLSMVILWTTVALMGLQVWYMYNEMDRLTQGYYELHRQVDYLRGEE